MSKILLGKLDWINPLDVNRSDENPRGSDFFKDKDFVRLKESVAKYGVIVPIITKKIAKGEGRPKYQLIDGERRWKAAIDTNWDKIPAYILSPEQDIDILATMFQIHMNQEDWDAVEQQRALEKIIETLKAEFTKTALKPDDIEKDLLKRLIEITGTDKDTALNRIRFFRWPKKIREYVYDNEPNKSFYSYVVEIEAKIVEPALRNYPDIQDRIPADKIRQALFDKALGGNLNRADEIRDAGILAKRRIDKKEATKARTLLMSFIEDKSFTFSEAREQYLNLFPEEARKQPFSVRRLINNITAINAALNEYTEPIIKRLKPPHKKALKNVLNPLLQTVEMVLRRLS